MEELEGLRRDPGCTPSGTGLCGTSRENVDTICGEDPLKKKKKPLRRGEWRRMTARILHLAGPHLDLACSAAACGLHLCPCLSPELP